MEFHPFFLETFRCITQVLFLTLSLRCVRKSRSKASKAIQLQQDSFCVKPGPQEMKLSVSQSNDELIRYIQGHNTRVGGQQQQQQQL